MGVKLGRSHWGRNEGWGCLRIGCWGGSLGLGGRRQQCIIKSLIVYRAHQIFLWLILSRRMRWAFHVACWGQETGIQVLVRKCEGKRTLGRPSRRRENKINLDLQELWCRCMDWIELAQNRDWLRAIVNVVMNFRLHTMWGIPWLAENRLTYQEGLCFVE